MTIKSELTMPTEELVGKAIDLLAKILDDEKIPASKVTAAAAILTAYGNLRPLERRLHEIPKEFPYGRGALPRT